MLNLTDSEKRDIVRCIEEGKELPEKYRFLLFKQRKQLELLWNGKTDEVTNVVLPFQTIEHVDTPRSEEIKELQLSLFDESGRQQKGCNKLIWGDNKHILSSLKHGPMREEIEKQGGIKLIYIDPPFDVGADFTMDVQIGDQSLEKKPNVLEQLAYRDTWGLGQDSFLSMIYERLILMRDLLADDGSIYVHCDYRVNTLLRIIMNEIFGIEPFFITHNNSNIMLKVDNPNEVGADRLCNAKAAINKVEGSCIIVDFGTATTYDILNEKQEFIGGAIAPGVDVSANYLIKKAALLKETILAFPKQIIAKNTKTNIQSGVMYGAIYSIEGMVENINRELNSDSDLILTGGFSSLISPKLSFKHTLEPHLTLEGIRLIYEESK